MRLLRRPAAVFAPVLALVLLAPTPWQPAGAAPAPAGPGRTSDSFLPNDFVLARVGPRTIQVIQFRESFFSSDPQVRPRTDSLGRVEFLGNLVNKDVLGLVAQTTGYKLSFEERAELRAYRNTILSNTLFMRTVRDSSGVTADSVRHVYEFYKRDLKLRLLRFDDRAKADGVRGQLLRGSLRWSVAATLYAPRLATPNGQPDWLRFESLPLDIALQVWPLRVGEVSPVILTAAGYYIVQIAESRPRDAPGFDAFRPMLKGTLQGLEADQRRGRIQEAAKQGLDVRYDSTNVRWACAHFRETMSMTNEGLGASLSIDANPPEFAPEDTSRTILTWKGGRLSLNDILHHFTDVTPLARPSINTPERFMTFADAILLEPRMVEMAERRGFDKDSTAVALIENQRESRLVTHMVEDSVFSRIFVTKEERKAYYERHRTGFVTYPKVRYALIVRNQKAGADSVVARLAAGVRAEAIVHEDSTRGEVRSGIMELQQNESSDFKKMLFDDMRPGSTNVLGPDKTKAYAAVHLISFDPGHQLPYSDVEAMIDESVRNEKSEAALKAFIARLSRRFAIESHPERVMGIRLMDPAGDDL